MRRIKMVLLLFALMVGATSVMAQPPSSNVVIFSKSGEKFTLSLNGRPMNQQPLANVKITGLIQPYYSAKIVFADPSLGEVDKKVPVRPGLEEVFVLKKNHKGRYVLRVQSATPINQLPPPPPGQVAIVYGTPPPPVVGATGTTVTTTTTSTTVPTGTSVGMNVGGVGVNMNVNAIMPNTTVSRTTTVTTRTNGAPVYGPPGAPVPAQYANGCRGPMSPRAFASAKRSIANQSFSEDKLKVAEQIFNSNCMSSEQVRRILDLFSFESTKLKFAKYAYGYTTDPQNFYKVNDAFSFSSSVDELDKFIRSHPAGY